MSRGGKIALVVVACLIAGGVVAWLSAPRDDPARATLDEALERFRRGADSGEGPTGAALGVYRYRTTGSESTAAGVLSATHEYDGVSTITLTRAPCGVLEHWQVLAGRWSETEFCAPPKGSGVRAIREFHEFFGNAEENAYRCRGDSPSQRLLRRPGTRFSSRCASNESSAESDSRVIGATTVSVAGERAEAIHTKTDVVLDGEVTGTSTREDWRRRRDGLLLRREVEANAKRNGTIDADYSESYTILLLSLRPQR